MKRILTTLLFILLLLTCTVSAVNMSVIGRTGQANTYAAVIKDGYVINAEGYDLRVYNVTTYAQVLALNYSGSEAIMNYSLAEEVVRVPDRIWYLHLDGNYLYAITFFRVYIYDATTPTSLSLVGTAESAETATAYGIATGDGNRGNSLAVSGDYMYGTLGDHGIGVWDISDKSLPVYRGRVMDANVPSAISVKTTNLSPTLKYLLVASGTGATYPDRPKLYIMNITADPATPSYIANVTAATGDDICQYGSEKIHHIAANASTVFYTVYHCGVYSASISTPESPSALGNLTGEYSSNTFNANDLHLVGNDLFVSTRYEGMKIVDVTNPAAMTIRDSYDNTIAAGGLAVAGYTENIYSNGPLTVFTAYSNGLTLVNTTTKTDIYGVAQLPMPVGVDSLVVVGDRVFAGGHSYGVQIINITNKTAPTLFGYSYTSGRLSDIDSDGTSVMAAASFGGFKVINVSVNATNPTKYDVLYTSANPGLGTVKYLSPYFYGDEGIWNLTAPKSPTEKAVPRWFSGGATQQTAGIAKINDSYIIVAISTANTTTAHPKGLFVWDISNITAPVEVGYALNGTTLYDVKANGTTIIASSFSTIYSLNASAGVSGNLTDRILQSYSTYGGGVKLAFDADNKNKIYAARHTDTSSIKEYDITDLTDMRYLSSINMPDTALDMGFRYAGGYLYWGSESSDMVILTTDKTKVNVAPVLAAIGSKNLPPNIAETFTISATDEDGDGLGYYATGLPTGATFTNATRTFSWTPTTGQVGRHNCTFWVNDTAGNTDSEKVFFNVSTSFAATTSTRFNVTTKDAIVYRAANNQTFAQISGGDGTAIINDSITLYARVETDSITNEFYRDRILILPVDTSSIPMNATVTNVTLFVYGYDKYATFGINKSLSLTYANLTNKSVPNYPDFQRIDRVPIAPNISYSSFSTTGWNAFILTNRSGVLPGNRTAFALLHNWSLDKSFGSGIWKTSDYDTMTIISADYTTDENKRPYILVEYTQPEEETAPVAAFDGTPTSGETPLDVTFTDLSTNTPTEWNWTFGGANFSEDQNPTYHFVGAGLYTVSLNASNAAGSNITTKADYITVNPVATPTPTPTSGSGPAIGDIHCPGGNCGGPIIIWDLLVPLARA